MIWDVIAIDGPVAAGKSSVARAVAERTGRTYLDTGAMYRVVGLVANEGGITAGYAEHAEELGRIASGIDISFDGGRVLAGGRDVTDDIRTPEIDMASSGVSAVKPVRDAMVGLQRKMAAGARVVCEGRDMGTVVFPDAAAKFYLTADPTVRARRRFEQRGGREGGRDADGMTLDEVLSGLRERDANDSGRESSPLRPADDAIVVDTTHMTQEEAVSCIVGVAEAQLRLIGTYRAYHEAIGETLGEAR